MINVCHKITKFVFFVFNHIKYVFLELQVFRKAVCYSKVMKKDNILLVLVLYILGKQKKNQVITAAPFMNGIAYLVVVNTN